MQNEAEENKGGWLSKNDSMPPQSKLFFCIHIFSVTLVMLVNLSS